MAGHCGLEHGQAAPGRRRQPRPTQHASSAAQAGPAAVRHHTSTVPPSAPFHPPFGCLSVQAEEAPEEEEPSLLPPEGCDAPPKLRTTAEEPGRASGMSSHCRGDWLESRWADERTLIKQRRTECNLECPPCLPSPAQHQAGSCLTRPHLLLHPAEGAAAAERGGLDAVVQAPVAVAAHAHAATAEVDALWRGRGVRKASGCEEREVWGRGGRRARSCFAATIAGVQ